MSIRRLLRCAVGVLFLCLAVPASAVAPLRYFDVSPPVQDWMHPFKVTARVDGPFQPWPGRITQQGSVIEVAWTAQASPTCCYITTVELQVGPLPAGHYTVVGRLYDASGHLWKESTASIEVDPALPVDIPSVSVVGGVALVIALAAFGVRRLC